MNGLGSKLIILDTRVWCVLQKKVKDQYLENAKGKLKLFQNFIGERKFFAGDKVTQIGTFIEHCFENLLRCIPDISSCLFVLDIAADKW